MVMIMRTFTCVCARVCIERESMYLSFFFPLKTGLLGDRRDTLYVYRTQLVGYTDKTNTTDIQTVDSGYSKTIHQEIQEDHKTKTTRDEGIEKHSFIHHATCHCSPACEE
jgi:hypothetical protein